ncbi:GGDEF domain-containing protein [Mycolicibacterium sphagni]|uniref:GGDEF domain-containing protein n=1 Tax=Mycolicibacterium sphagni TaxID=1786 RepID=A0A255DTT9_9MYCO|nr:GGDEF domain-containing protein [Mycolicibacterium sphagni]MCV7174407.1 GGDEF domain-containing protein [Mycolicibacterium sphagni]OYN79063.1 GGDEF domain-containing protein [Mycolicibacterium sphagni]
MRLLAYSGSGFYGKQQVRLLEIYLGITTFLYLYGVVFTIWPVRTDLTYANPIGGVLAICLGIAALFWLAAKPDKPGPATAVAIIATPLVMAFHIAISAEFACLIAPMFLAMYLRAFYPPRRALVLIGLLTAAVVVALAVAPLRKLVIDYLIVVAAIVGASESFGLVMRALVTSACTDPLTGLLNRAGWEIATRDIVARRRSPKSVMVSVVVMDLDGFKQINDTRGHLAGDEHLASHARRWRELLPADALLARLGGDEFAACIVDRAEGKTPAAEQFVTAVGQHTPDTSVGIASRPGDTAEIAALYSKADAELYAAKVRNSRRTGR